MLVIVSCQDRAKLLRTLEEVENQLLFASFHLVPPLTCFSVVIGYAGS